MEWSGVEWSGVEWSGVEWSGVEWSGVEWSGVEWSGVEWSGVEWSGMESSRVEWSGVEWSRVEWSGVETNAKGAFRNLTSNLSHTLPMNLNSCSTILKSVAADTLLLMGTRVVSLLSVSWIKSVHVYSATFSQTRGGFCMILILFPLKINQIIYA